MFFFLTGNKKDKFKSCFYARFYIRRN